MKLILPLLLLFLVAPRFNSFGQSSLVVKNGTIVGDTDIYNRGQQEIRRTQDPKLKIVPVQRIINANAVRTQLLKNQPSANKSGFTPAVINTLQWNERGPTNVGGRTRGLIFDLGDAANGYKKVFAGGVGGGIWFTTDITATPVNWNKVNDFFNNIAISFIVQDPVNPLIIYASTGEGFGVGTQGLGVWKTTDGGKTWTQLTNTSSFTYITSMLVDKNGNVYLSADTYGIQQSRDGGNTWTQVLGAPVFGNGADGADLELSANGDVYAATGDFSTGEIFTSSAALNGANLGNTGTWTNITPDVHGIVTSSSTDWWRIKLACAPNDPNTVYGLFNGSGQAAATSLQRYDKFTNSWSVKTIANETFSNNQGWYALALAVDPNDANTLLAGSLDLQKSTDAGATWNQLSYWYYDDSSPLYIHADHQGYVYAPGSSSRSIMGTDGGVSYSSTINAATPSFLTQDNGYNVTQFYSVALHPTSLNYALAGAQDNGTQQFTTAGLNATSDASDGDGADAFIDQINPNIQITSYVYNKHWISVDGGQNFTKVFFNKHGGFINPSDYDSKNEILYSGDIPGSYFRWSQVALASTSTGISVPVPAFSGASVTNVTVSPVTPNRVYFGLDNGTMVMVDNADGSSVQKTTVFTSSTSSWAAYTSVSSISIDPASEAHILMTFSNYGISHVVETKNAFDKSPVWTVIDGNLPDMPVRWSMFYPDNSGMAIIATELGVWTTNFLNGSSTNWLPTNTDLANTRVDMLKYRALDRTVAAASYGRGLFTATAPYIKQNQTITFAATDTVNYGAANIAAVASSNGVFPITYTSSNIAVCTITGSGMIHILGKGTSTITASEAGNNIVSPAADVTQLFTVLPAVLTITALDEAIIYGEPIPTLPVTYAGFVNGDLSSGMLSPPVTRTTALTTSAAGNYPITPSGANGGPNYTIIYKTGSLTVSPAPAPVITSISTTTVKTGTIVTINGIYLMGATSVSFGGINASSFTVISASSITAIVGAGATGRVTITTPSGMSSYYSVFFIPVPVISKTSSTVIYNGDGINLSVSPVAGFTVQWFREGVEIAGATDSYYLAAQPGTYSAEISLNGISQLSDGLRIQAFSSDSTNFRLTKSPLICSGSEDGKISLVATQILNYIATLNQGNKSTVYTFTDSLNISNLSTGTYSLCISVPEIPGFSKCYRASIESFPLIGVISSVDITRKQVNLVLSGSDTYSIDFNKIITTTTNSEISLPLLPGINSLTISTPKSCQGIINRSFTNSNNIIAFPNPFTSSLSIDLGKATVQKTTVSLYSTAGILVFSSSYQNHSGVITFAPTGLTTGIYILKLVTDGTESVFHLIRK